MVQASGGAIAPDKTTVLGLRGIDPQGARHDSNQNVGPYDDTFVVLQHDANGDAQVKELLGSTHAGQKTGLNPTASRK